MVADVRYVFGNILTGETIAEMPLQGVSMARHLDGGEFRGTLHLDRTGISNDTAIAAVVPGRSFIVCERDARPIWGGLVWTATYQSQSKSVQVYAKDLKDYGERRIIRDDVAYVSTEQTQIFLDLYGLMQSDPNSVQVELPDVVNTGILRSLEVTRSDFRDYRSAIDSIANADEGFDWLIDWTRTGGVYTRTMRIGYPTLGAAEHSGSPVLDYFDVPDQGDGGNIVNYWRNDTMSGAGTHIYGIGGGEGEIMLTSEYIHTALLSGGFPRYDVALSYKDILDQGTLDSLTMRQALLRRSPAGIYTVEVKGDTPGLEFGDYEVGDYVRLNIRDALHPGNGIDVAKRILGWEYYPPSDSEVEYARLSFEGEDID
jgi:hypothetical protein